MSSSKFNKKVCRICLGDKELFNWNKEIFEFCGLTYKDCYYNYVQLDESYSNFYPNQLCEMCANDLKNAHFLFERALESFYILHNCINSKTLFTDYSDVEICNSMPAARNQSEIYQTAGFSEYLELEETKKHINNKKYVSDNITANAENLLNDYQGIVISNVEEIGIDQFKDMHQLGSPPENFLEDQLCQISDTEISDSLPYKRKDKNTSENNSSTSNLDDDETVPKSEVSENSEEAIINCQPTPDQHLREESTVYQPVKTRKKYILICQYCSLEVNGTNLLKKHEATHSENRERTHTCTKCGLKLYTQGGLNEHMKIHEENRQKNHKCEFCEKAFYNKGALNVHRRVHLGLMFKCQICLKEFFRQIDLDRHLPSHSVSPLRKNVVKKQYVVQCQYCNKTVMTHKLKEHMAVHSNQPQMKCKICDKQFYNRTKCVNHLRRFHRKEKSQYNDFIHNLVNCNGRISHLKIKQSAHVQTITK